LNVWLRGSSNSADGVAVNRRVAPAEHAQTLLANDPLQNAFAVQTGMLLDRQKGHPDGVLARSWQSDTQRGALTRKKLVRNLNQNTRAVTGLRIAAAGASVGQVDQDLNALLDNLVALVAANAGNKADATRVMLMRRVVKTPRRRQSVICLPMLQKHLPRV
jgi:hypothetical protein